MNPMVFILLIIAGIWALGQIMAKRLENHLKKYGMPQSRATTNDDDVIDNYSADYSKNPFRVGFDDHYSSSTDPCDDIYTDPSYSSMPGNIWHHDD